MDFLALPRFPIRPGVTPVSLALDIQTGFPPHVVIPKHLLYLCSYAEVYGDGFSGGFQLRARQNESVFAWFQGDAEAAGRLAAFGAAGDGSTYAYWRPNPQSVTRLPVVFLGHDGPESTVLASSTREFLSLLAIGYNELGYDYRDEPPPPDQRLLHFREWLDKEFRIKPAPSASAVVESAAAQHPGFWQWLDEWFRGHELT
jgi:hypothetical protein